MNKEDKQKRDKLVSQYPVKWIRKNIYSCKSLATLEQISIDCNCIPRVANNYGHRIEINIDTDYYEYTISKTNILEFITWVDSHCKHEGYSGSKEWQQDIYHAMHIPLPLHLQGCYFKNEKVN